MLVEQLLSEESSKRRGPVAVTVLHGTESVQFQLPRPTDAIPAPGPVEPGLTRSIHGAHSDVAVGASETQHVHQMDTMDMPSSAPDSLLPSEAGHAKGGSKRSAGKQRRRGGRDSSNSSQFYSSPMMGAGGSNLLRKKQLPNRKSEEAWIPPAVRRRFIERNLAATKVNLDDRNNRANLAMISSRRQTLTELEQNHAEEQFKIKRKKQCGLCFRDFSAVNMALTVPNKAIFDLQSTWEEKNSWVQMTDAQKRKYQNPVKQKPSALYNEVPVCVYCSQFFKHGQQDIYRPSYESKVKERRARAELHAAEQAKAYWDPLTTVENMRKSQLAMWEKQVRTTSAS